MRLRNDSFPWGGRNILHSSPDAIEHPSRHTDFADSACPRKTMEIWVAIGMVSHVMSLFFHAPHDIRILLGSSSYDKKRSLHREIPQNIQYPRSINRIRTVIDCYSADTGYFAGFRGEGYVF